MRLVRLTCAIAALALVACGGGGDDGGGGDGDGGNGMGGGDDYVTFTGISPDHGPLAGGNSVIVSGTGFTRINAAPNMLLVGGRTAVSVSVLTDTEIEVIVPAGTSDGSVDVTLFNNNGAVTISDAYSYNPLPTITGLSPDTGVYTGGQTVTVTGTGFQNLEPGTNTIKFGGLEGTVTDVASDTQLTVTTPEGPPALRVDVTIDNDNGAGAYNGYLYTTTGLVTFGHDYAVNVGDIIALDQTDASVTTTMKGQLVEAQRISSAIFKDGRLYVALRRDGLAEIKGDGSVEYIGPFVNCQRSVTSMAEHNGVIYATCRSNPDGSRFGSIDLTTGEYTGIGGDSAAFGSRPNVVSDGTTLWVVRSSNVGEVNPADGTVTNVMPHNLGGPRGAVFRDGTLYVINRGIAGKGGSDLYQLWTMVPSTGATTSVGIIIASIHALVAP